ncbi:MAG TPA: CotH kinase family protein [Saprospiraceae bacterium]|mgnify:FL=1|nr:CotH kinase family protein [Saprospiraceae bacterium]
MTNLYRLFLLLISFIIPAASTNAQSYVKSNTAIIPGNRQELFDTIEVANLQTPNLNGDYGLDSVTLSLNYDFTEDLVISLIAPDGTVVQLANNLGGEGDNFENTCFTMHVRDLVNYFYPPFMGKMRPESWLGNVNNGQIGTGNWILHILNTTTTENSGILVKWGLHFNSTPAPPPLLTSSTLPILMVNTHNNVIPYITKEEVTGTMGIIDNAPSLNHLNDPFNGYNGQISIKVRGSSSAYFPQHSYTVTTKKPSGSSLDTTLLGMPDGSKWVLYGAWNDKSLIRNILTYQLSNEMGDYAPRTRLCELVLNGDYAGIYVLMEKIKRGENRVDVEKLSSNTVSGPDLTGGYIFQVDRGNGVNDSWYSQYAPCEGSDRRIAFVYEYPDEDDINTAQKNYIASYVDSFESALLNVSLYDTINGYRKYIDLPSFMDQSLLQELGHNVDGYRLSSFLHKHKNQKLKGGPIWDFNLAYGNADYYDGSAVNTYAWDFPCPSGDYNLPPFWWKRFTTDSIYIQELKCRYTNFRQTAFAIEHIDFVMDSLKSILQIPQSRHFTRWPILGIYLWPNVFIGNSWTEEMDYLNTWLKNRISWMDSQLYDSICLTKLNNSVVLHQKNEKINIYPNPTSGIIKIETSAEPFRHIQIYNSIGILVYDQSVHSNLFTLDLREIVGPSGIYSVIVTTSGGTIAKKIIFLSR